MSTRLTNSFDIVYSLGMSERKKRRVRIALELPKDLRLQLESSARSQDRSLSAEIRTLLLRALAQNEKTA